MSHFFGKISHYVFLINSLLFCSNLSATPLTHNPIIFASSEYPPHYGTDLVKQGVVIEIVRRAFAKQQLNIDVAFMPFARAMHDTKQGLYSGVIAIWYTEARTEKWLYSEPIYANHIVLFKRKADFRVKQNLDTLLAGNGTLGFVTGYLQQPLLQQSNLSKVSVASEEQLFKMLAMQRVDFVPADLQSGLYFISRLPVELRQSAIDWLEPALEIHPMHLAFPKHHPNSEYLKQQFDLGLQALKDSGEFAELLHQLLPEPSK
ncbi:transporter substrate-binding domain-containing protein [Alishewanella sp. 16-MA]|uniref:Transporter substrate-binding domain-containing protein n=1 Tax=Alishewanella maricola TaxID=2795740 RepID=A0ABS8BYZ8_9ALTE|nr:transporter substrate-binding domain-containing protein [Alishewanella maricola]